MKIFRNIAVSAFLFLALAACSGGDGSVEEGAGKPEVKVSTSTPAVQPATEEAGGIIDMDPEGLEAYLQANKGKPTMIMLWATWCPSCKQQIPELELLSETHGDKLNIIAMSLDENRPALERYLEKKPIDLTVAWGDQQIARNHNVEAIPTLLIFDKSGKKIFGQSGVFPASMLGAMADRLAGE